MGERSSAGKILVIGTFDSKQQEYRFLIEKIRSLGCPVIALDVGTFSQGLGGNVETITNRQVLEAADSSLDAVVETNDRGQAMKLMARGAAIITRKLYDQAEIAGVVGMGGSGGSSVISAAMRSLPIGFPKVLLSTMAGGDTRPYVGSKDIILIPAITDVAGLNRISRTMITNTAAVIAGLAQSGNPSAAQDQARQVIAISMFGNTTACVDQCRSQLENDQTEVVVFHATGTGGQTMEELIEDGFVDGCLDITITELADEVCGGVLSAGPNRLSAAGRRGIPHLVVPGCVDMVNFGAMETVPEKYRSADRIFYEWNPAVTLMRTNVEENIRIGKLIVEHLNRATGPVHVLLPLRGVSILDGDGERFCDRQADQALFDTLKQGLSDSIPVTELDLNINDPHFADCAVRLFREMMDSTGA